MRGSAGDFVNVTWPGYAGTLTASAPGRFAAAINQAPLWRRTRRPWLRPYDLAMNALRTWPIRFCPPDHLLREVFETCRDFGAAKRRLETVPIARPVIFTLIGCERGERCVIERTEQAFATRDQDTSAANDWLRTTTRWEARVCASRLLTDFTGRGRGQQQRPARGACVLAASVRACGFRLGDAAGAQSLYPHCGGDVRGERNAAGGRLRARAGQRTAAAGDACLRAGAFGQPEFPLEPLAKHALERPSRGDLRGSRHGAWDLLRRSAIPVRSVHRHRPGRSASLAGEQGRLEIAPHSDGFAADVGVLGGARGSGSTTLR